MTAVRASGFGGIEAWMPGPVHAGLLRDYRGRAECRPEAIVFPRSTAEVAQVLADCARQGLKVIPQGGNTGLSFGTLPEPGMRFVLLNMARMNAVRAHVPGQGLIVVEAGCILADVVRLAESAGETLGISLGSAGSCQIGGVLATNAGGETVLRHGMARDQVLGVEAVFGDGTVWSQLSGMAKNNGGYDIRHLLCGSEGTLAVITAASLRLSPLPVSREAAVMHLSSLRALPALLALARRMLGSGLAMVELANRFALSHAGLTPAATVPDWAVLIDAGLAAGEDDAGAVLGRLFERACAEGLVSDGIISASHAQRARILELRVRIGDTLPAIGRFFALDTGVPPHRIPDFVTDATAILASALPGAEPYVFGHAGDGTIHFSARVPDAAGQRHVERAIEAINARAVTLGGSATAEHGVGRLCRDRLAARLRPAELALLCRIKRALDPEGILNPGAVLPPMPHPEGPGPC